ncbi:metal ABC transporter substrate-binding protein [Lysinibacter sp. HNR]|uniref:metal ABC transporter substrate-binding protein n=1 Tax=Lysinibacter sp. HNR TaxID=3031408 RepID=UPI00325BC435
MRRLFTALSASVLLLAGFTACSPGEDQPPLVVVTTNILGDVVQNVVGDEVTVVTLMKPGADPHSFQISAREASRILSADLIVHNGLGLEVGLEHHLDAARRQGVPMLAVGDALEPPAPGSQAHHGHAHGPPPRDEGGAGNPDESAEAMPDPHFWTDPQQMITVVRAISEGVRKNVRDVNERAIRDHEYAYTAELVALDREMGEAFSRIPPERRKLVTNHHVFGYFADRFGFTLVGAVIPSATTLAAPSAADLHDLTSVLNDAGVETIFAESSQSDKLIRVLADEVNLDVTIIQLYTESLDVEGSPADTYLAMMRTNTERIVTGLSPPE